MTAPVVKRWDGQPISEPGVYAGLPIEAYHDQPCAGASTTSSVLRTIFNKSAAHAWVKSSLNPEREDDPPNEALLLGRGAHHLLLGESDFEKHFVIRPEELNGKPWHSNRGDCKLWLEAMAAERLQVLLPSHIAKIKGMRASLGANPLVRAGILNGLIEHSIIWRDAETGIWLQVRPDAIPTSAADFSDLKTTTDVSHDAVERAVGSFGYHMQGALVGMACKEVLGVEMNSFSLVFVEKDAPHCTRVVTLKPADLELGAHQVRMALRVFARCIETGEWPGPGGTQSDAEYVEIKPWDRSRIETRMALLEQELAA